MAEKITLEDFYRARTLQTLALSPSGDYVAYIEAEPIRGADAVSRNLWLVSTAGGEPHRLTRSRSQDGQPKWSPDGRYLAFLSSRPTEMELMTDEDWEKPDTEPKSQIWVFDRIAGGEPRQATNRAEGVESFDWSPDSARLVFASRDPSDDEERYLKAIRDDKKPGPLVINRMQHKHDGDGYLDNVRTHLFIAALAERTVTRLTEGPADETNPRWSPDGAWIMFFSNRTGDADNNNRTDLWLIRPDASETRRLTQGDVGVSSALFAPDSGKVAFVTSGRPENSYVLERLYTIELGKATPVVSLTQCIGQGWSSVGGVVPDQVEGDPVAHARVYPAATGATPMHLVSESFAGMVSRLVAWNAEGIVALAHDQAQSKLMRFSTKGEFETLIPTDRMGTVVQADANAHGIAVIYNAPQHGSEVYFSDRGSFRRLTHAGAWLDDRTVGTYHWIQYPNHDGVTVEALVLTPPGFEPGRDHAPLLVNIHGGPMWYDTPQFEFDTQYWANRGYVVLMVNYRGSISYGEAFCQSIQGDWGPREHDDVMCGVDYLVEQGWTREDQLFCTGFSQGGIMTNWAVGHTDRFRAAVSEHGMWDYVSAFGTDDCHLWWQDDLGVPWQNPETYYRISPMSGLANIRTPLLITAGEHDWRCPLNQAEELYVALKKRGVPTELIIYPGEHHAITRPARAIDRLKRIDDWLARYGGIAVADTTTH